MKHAFPLLTKSRHYDTLDLVALLTMLCLLFVSHDMRVFAGLALFAVLVSSTLRRSPWFWLLIAVAWWPQLIFRWERHEDHSYLINYWCLALGLSLLGSQSYATLKQNARLLIGLTFAFGCFWKITSPDFADSSLNLYNMLFDTRFNTVFASPFGLVPDQSANEQVLAAVRAGVADVNWGQITYQPGLNWMAQAMTWWTIAIEAALALFFLVPRMSVSRRLKDASLMLFTATTYFFVPVLGFGCLFCAMGAAQCEPRQRMTRGAYLMLALVILYRGNMLSA